MGSTARHLHTLHEYFAIERVSPHKHEFFDGDILAMAGGTVRHNHIESNVTEALTRRLSRPCRTKTSNQRIATPDGLYTYSDGSVFCGRIEEGAEQTALNPVLLVEVLSDGTRSYDRGEKLEQYKAIPSLRHVLLVDQRIADIEVWTRGERGWTREVHTSVDDDVQLDALGVRLPVAEIYEGADEYPL